jgi:branched-chain amino acid transport system substrate-binding protein
MGARAIAATCAFALAATAAGCGGDRSPGRHLVAGRVLHVYSSLPLQGDLAARAQDVQFAERLALDRVHGRVGRFRVGFAALDDSTLDAGGWDPNLVAANARRAARDRRTIAYLGELDGGASAVSIPTLNDRGILQVSPTDGLAGLTHSQGATRGEPAKYYPDPRRNFARLAPPDDLQAAALVQYMKELGVRRLYVVNDGGGYGVSLAERVASVAAAQGLGVVANETVTSQGADYQSVSRRVMAGAPDGFFFGGVARDRIEPLWLALHAAAPRLKLFGPNALAVSDFTSRLGPSASSTYLTDIIVPPRVQPPAARAFATEFRRLQGHDPDPYAIYGYEAMKAVLQAIRKCKRDGNDRQCVIDALLGLHRRGTVLGNYSIDRRGDPSLRSFGAYRVRRARPVFDRVLTPVGG